MPCFAIMLKTDLSYFRHKINNKLSMKGSFDV
jgi:hypothetical protein